MNEELWAEQIKDLEKKLAKANKIIMENDRVIGIHINHAANNQKTLAVAKEALEFINTYKSPDYVNLPRGSVFDVSREALKQLSEQSLEKKLKDCGVGII